ncbi:NUDIX hydrolase [Citroniella saccharovorans]|uniref:NUDIX hydrolase n=1 Tax=Citroniella saccharovorans TaxID=2053367 RepID=A0AAW9MZW1_9FIRM|nr:NUDIX hydrolase [Citroniella saccharovorans]MEB3429597.1 NUDIX hydrolase [Citroniella saccharovorans]
MNEIEKTMKTEILYEGKILTLRVDTVELPDMKYSKREIIEHSPSVVIIPMIDDENVFVIKQYRKAVDKVLYEFPAGLLESGEDPKEAALRELQEEIKYTADKIEFLFDMYSSPGFTNEKVSVFLARDLKPKALKEDDDEYIECEKISIKDLIQKLDSLELIDSKIIAGTLYLKNLMLNE